ncbi:hypothetical protein E8E14_002955 [Neopestalotiopsis sp. 37M]|nr:hypothetical protein E8E14_002955 [Neopestalotiopsis sp. 37M]
MTGALGRLSIGLKDVLEEYRDDDVSTTSGESYDSTDSLEDNIHEMTKDLQTDTLCLMDLGNLFRDPVLDSIRETEKSAPYESLVALDHKLEPHWKSFECPLCLASTGAGMVAVTKHLGTHLEEISLAVIPRDVGSESDWEGTEERGSDETSSEASSEASSKASSEAVVSRSPETYVYAPMKERYGQDFRVIIIEPGARKDPICCRLVPSALNDARAKAGTKAYPFSALSYVWGDGDPIHSITLTSYASPSRKIEALSRDEQISAKFVKGRDWTENGNLQVRTNLYRALKRFRSKTELVTMWIDALCIDQTDENERSAQVKKIHELYVNSQSLCIWLGTGEGDEPNPKHCFQFLKRLLHMKDLESALKSRSKGELSLVQNVDNIMRLMCNEWFRRRWVLQEVALARKAKVVYGRAKMKWSDFTDAIAIFTESFDLIRSILKEETNAPAVDDLVTTGTVRNLSANIFINVTNNLFQRGERGEIQQRMMTLEGLVSSLVAFEVTDPRDTIYAVLSLAKDTYHLTTDPHENAAYLGFDQRLTPNYKHKSLMHVYTEFIDYCIEKSGSLDILFRHWAPSMERNRLPSSLSEVPTVGEYYKKEDSLPSWIPRLQNSSHGTPGQRNGGRANGDSFVGASQRSGQRNYSAASDFPPTYKFGEEELSPGSTAANKKYNGRLSVKGLHIGTINQVGPRAAYGVIFRDAFDIAIAGFEKEHWISSQESTHGVPRVPEEFWRTLVGDRGPNGSNPPSWYARACLDCLDNLTEDGDLQPDVLIASDSTSRLTKDFLERVKNVIWQRRLGRVHLKNDSEYALGLFPAETREDDLVCIFFGCSVPVVLRASTQDPGHYTMVGECFVYGMMEGEAVTGRSPDNDNDDVQFFELV